MSEPKQPVDPIVDPNVTPPEGDNPPAGEDTKEYWQKKYGDGENEKGDLRKKLDTEQANSEFWQHKAQENVQAPPQAPNNGNLDLDPMGENFGQNLVATISNTVTGVIQTQANKNLVEQHTQELMGKYNLSREKAIGVLRYGYDKGANSSEQAKTIFTRDLADMGSEFLGGQQPPANPNPKPANPPPPNQVRYNVQPPPVPAGGEPGSGSQMAKMPSIDEWNAMTDDEKRAHKSKVQSGQVEFDDTNAVFTPIA